MLRDSKSGGASRSSCRGGVVGAVPAGERPAHMEDSMNRFELVGEPQWSPWLLGHDTVPDDVRYRKALVEARETLLDVSPQSWDGYVSAAVEIIDQALED